MITITSSNSFAPFRRIHTQSQLEKIDEDLFLRTFDLIRDAVFLDFCNRMAEYRVQYKTVLLCEDAPTGVCAGHRQVSCAVICAR